MSVPNRDEDWSFDGGWDAPDDDFVVVGRWPTFTAADAAEDFTAVDFTAEDIAAYVPPEWLAERGGLMDASTDVEGRIVAVKKLYSRRGALMCHLAVEGFAGEVYVYPTLMADHGYQLKVGAAASFRVTREAESGRFVATSIEVRP